MYKPNYKKLHRWLDKCANEIQSIDSIYDLGNNHFHFQWLFPPEIGYRVSGKCLLQIAPAVLELGRKYFEARPDNSCVVLSIQCQFNELEVDIPIPPFTNIRDTASFLDEDPTISLYVNPKHSWQLTKELMVTHGFQIEAMKRQAPKWFGSDYMMIYIKRRVSDDMITHGLEFISKDDDEFFPWDTGKIINKDNISMP